MTPVICQISPHDEILILQMVQQGRGLRGADSEGGGGRQQRAVLQAPRQGQHPLRDLSQENVGHKLQQDEVF